MGDFNYAIVIDDFVWSYSRVSSFDDCRYAWYRKYLLEEPETRQCFYASFGSFVHEILEKYYNNSLKKDELVRYFLLNFQDKVKGDRPSKDIVDKYIQSAIQYLESFEPLPYRVIGVEKFISFTIDDVKMVGYLDYIGEDESGNIIIVDNKSRNLKQRSKRKKQTQNDIEIDNMLRQLYIYSAAVYKEFGKFPKYLCFNCFRNGEFIKEEFDMGKYEESIRWLKKTIEEVRTTDDFYPNIDYFYCRYLCGYGNDCEYVQR